MANSTARAEARNPVDSAIPVEPSLTEILGPEGSHLSPALAARVMAAIQHADTPAANSRPPAFFAAMDRRSTSASSMGGTWEHPNIQRDHSLNLAMVDNALSGISGVAEILAAAECARAEDDVERHLSENLTEKLFNALLILTDQARDTLEDVRERMCKDTEVRS